MEQENKHPKPPIISHRHRQPRTEPLHSTSATNTSIVYPYLPSPANTPKNPSLVRAEGSHPTPTAAALPTSFCSTASPAVAKSARCCKPWLAVNAAALGAVGLAALVCVCLRTKSRSALSQGAVLCGGPSKSACRVRSASARVVSLSRSSRSVAEARVEKWTCSGEGGA